MITLGEWNKQREERLLDCYDIWTKCHLKWGYKNALDLRKTLEDYENDRRTSSSDREEV